MRSCLGAGVKGRGSAFYMTAGRRSRLTDADYLGLSVRRAQQLRNASQGESERVAVHSP